MTFRQKIRSAQWWMGTAALVDGLCWGAAWAAGLVFLVVVADKLVLAHTNWRLVGQFGAGIVAATALVTMARRTPKATQAALVLDAVHSTKERLVTALHTQNLDHPFRDAILADAERIAPRIIPIKAAQCTALRPFVSAVLLLAAAGAINRFVPERDLFGVKQEVRAQAVVKQAIAAETRKLEELEQKLAKPPGTAPALDPSKKAISDIAALKKQFADQKTPDARDAVAKLSSLSDKLAQEKEKLKEQSRAEVGKMDKTPEIRQQTERLEKALRRGDMEAAQGELGRLEQQAAGEGRTPEDNQKLGKALSNLGKALAGQPELSAAMNKAGEGLQKGDSAESKEGFDEAKKAMDKVAAAQSEMQKLDEALSALEKSRQQMADAAKACENCKGGKQSPGGEGSDKERGGDGEKSESSESKGNQQAGGDSNETSGSQSQQSGLSQNQQDGGQGEGEGKIEIGSGGKSSGGNQQSSSGGQGSSGGQSGGQGGSSGQGSQQGQGSGGTQQAGGSSSSSSSASGGSSGSAGGQPGGQGQGSGSPDWGIGSTNLEGSGKYDAVAKAGSNRQSNRSSDWKEDFVKLYDARQTATKDFSTQAKGRIGEGQFSYSMDVQGQPTGERAKTEAAKTFMDYREAQKDAINKEDIPTGYKEFVKGYFDSIEPPK
ncbi:MAG: hypothetical protein K1X53_15770 [Candidatus Sumerlaeaceae bacterium]|nr:hypothetical protein [Candidatus Sumerlaeaceae bacterium]